jgi:hypothetical protein
MQRTTSHEHDDSKIKEDAEINVVEHEPQVDIDQEFLAAPKRIRFYRGVFFQMILFGA